ncbi:MAG: OmpH family outer membrane protein [Alphaproteobacteria bacterium]|nr:OmpH family outer membrane protein [Alphaproteobacteria bacterium]
MTYFRLMRVFLLSIFVLTGIGVAGAQELETPKIAVLDVERVERSSQAWQSLSTQINAKREEYQKEVAAIQEALKQKGKELEGQRSLLAPEVFKQKVAEFQQERAALQQQTTDRKKLLDQAYGIGRQQIRAALNKVILVYAEANKIDMILNRGSKSGVVHFVRVNKFDIGEAIIELLNQELSIVEIPSQ